MRTARSTATWMHRHDVSWVEIVFCAMLIGAGLHVYVTPARMASVVTLDGPAAVHPAVAMAAVVAGGAVVIGRLASMWGPVRLGRADVRWRMLGSGSRAERLRRRCVRVLVVVAIGGGCVGVASALWAPSSIVVLTALGVAGGGSAGVIAYLSQILADRRQWPRPGGGRVGFPESMHRNTFSPHDGLSEAVRSAITLLDVSWIDIVRIIRWQHRHRSSPVATSTLERSGRQWLCGSLGWTVLCLDLRRIRRHPADIVRWAAWVAAAVVLSSFTKFHIGVPVPASVFLYGAGLTLSGGLRQVSEQPALRRAMARSDVALELPHAIVPLAAVIVAGALTLPLWGVSPLAGLILVVGVGLAVFRRATRTDLPYASPTVPDPFTGLPMQPLLVLAELRGLIALIAVAVLAAVV